MWSYSNIAVSPWTDARGNRYSASQGHGYGAPTGSQQSNYVRRLVDAIDTQSVPHPLHEYRLNWDGEAEEATDQDDAGEAEDAEQSAHDGYALPQIAHVESKNALEVVLSMKTSALPDPPPIPPSPHLRSVEAEAVLLPSGITHFDEQDEECLAADTSSDVGGATPADNAIESNADRPEKPDDESEGVGGEAGSGPSEGSMDGPTPDEAAENDKSIEEGCIKPIIVDISPEKSSKALADPPTHGSSSESALDKRALPLLEVPPTGEPPEKNENPVDDQNEIQSPPIPEVSAADETVLTLGEKEEVPLHSEPITELHASSVRPGSTHSTDKSVTFAPDTKSGNGKAKKSKKARQEAERKARKEREEAEKKTRAEKEEADCQKEELRANQKPKDKLLEGVVKKGNQVMLVRENKQKKNKKGKKNNKDGGKEESVEATGNAVEAPVDDDAHVPTSAATFTEIQPTEKDLAQDTPENQRYGAKEFNSSDEISEQFVTTLTVDMMQTSDDQGQRDAPSLTGEAEPLADEGANAKTKTLVENASDATAGAHTKILIDSPQIVGKSIQPKDFSSRNSSSSDRVEDIAVKSPEFLDIEEGTSDVDSSVTIGDDRSVSNVHSDEVVIVITDDVESEKHDVLTALENGSDDVPEAAGLEYGSPMDFDDCEAGTSTPTQVEDLASEELVSTSTEKHGEVEKCLFDSDTEVDDKNDTAELGLDGSREISLEESSRTLHIDKGHQQEDSSVDEASRNMKLTAEDSLSPISSDPIGNGNEDDIHYINAELHGGTILLTAIGTSPDDENISTSFEPLNSPSVLAANTVENLEQRQTEISAPLSKRDGDFLAPVIVAENEFSSTLAEVSDHIENEAVEANSLENNPVSDEEPEPVVMHEQHFASKEFFNNTETEFETAETENDTGAMEDSVASEDLKESDPAEDVGPDAVGFDSVVAVVGDSSHFDEHSNHEQRELQPKEPNMQLVIDTDNVPDLDQKDLASDETSKAQPHYDLDEAPESSEGTILPQSPDIEKPLKSSMGDEVRLDDHPLLEESENLSSPKDFEEMKDEDARELELSALDTSEESVPGEDIIMTSPTDQTSTTLPADGQVLPQHDNLGTKSKDIEGPTSSPSAADLAVEETSNQLVLGIDGGDVAINDGDSELATRKVEQAAAQSLDPHLNEPSHEEVLEGSYALLQEKDKSMDNFCLHNFEPVSISSPAQEVDSQQNDATCSEGHRLTEDHPKKHESTQPVNEHSGDVMGEKAFNSAESGSQAKEAEIIGDNNSVIVQEQSFVDPQSVVVQKLEHDDDGDRLSEPSQRMDEETPVDTGSTADALDQPEKSEAVDGEGQSTLLVDTCLEDTSATSIDDTNQNETQGEATGNVEIEPAQLESKLTDQPSDETNPKVESNATEADCVYDAAMNEQQSAAQLSEEPLVETILEVDSSTELKTSDDVEFIAKLETSTDTLLLEDQQVNNEDPGDKEAVGDGGGSVCEEVSPVNPSLAALEPDATARSSAAEDVPLANESTQTMQSPILENEVSQEPGVVDEKSEVVALDSFAEKDISSNAKSDVATEAPAHVSHSALESLETQSSTLKDNSEDGPLVPEKCMPMETTAELTAAAVATAEVAAIQKEEYSPISSSRHRRSRRLSQGDSSSSWNRTPPKKRRDSGDKPSSNGSQKSSGSSRDRDAKNKLRTRGQEQDMPSPSYQRHRHHRRRRDTNEDDRREPTARKEDNPRLTREEEATNREEDDELLRKEEAAWRQRHEERRVAQRADEKQRLAEKRAIILAEEEAAAEERRRRRRQERREREGSLRVAEEKRRQQMLIEGEGLQRKKTLSRALEPASAIVAKKSPNPMMKSLREQRRRHSDRLHEEYKKGESRPKRELSKSKRITTPTKSNSSIAAFFGFGRVEPPPLTRGASSRDSPGRERRRPRTSLDEALQSARRREKQKATDFTEGEREKVRPAERQRSDSPKLSFPPEIQGIDQRPKTATPPQTPLRERATSATAPSPRETVRRKTSEGHRPVERREERPRRHRADSSRIMDDVRNSPEESSRKSPRESDQPRAHRRYSHRDEPPSSPQMKEKRLSGLFSGWKKVMFA